MNRHTSKVLAALVVAGALAIAADARAEVFAADQFLVGESQYTAGDLYGQNPTVDGFTNAWGLGDTSTGTVKVNATGLTWSGLLPAPAGGVGRVLLQ